MIRFKPLWKPWFPRSYRKKIIFLKGGYLQTVSVDPPTTIEDPLASSTMIWITNLPKTTKANEIKEEYEKLGFKEAIVTCKIAVNKKTQAAFGFVEMPHVEGILSLFF